MEVSRGTAYGVGFSQCAVTLGVILFFPQVRVDLFIAHVHVNGTMHANRDLVSDIQPFEAHLALPVLLASALTAVFTTVTCKSFEQGVCGQDFQQDVVEQLGMWDLIFWVYCLLAHGIVTLLVADPVDLYGCISSTTFMVYFLCKACGPKGPSLNITQENLNILGYCLGVLQLAYQISSTRGNGASIVMMTVVLDYFLGVGHTYDRQATIDTIMNCRLFYACACSLGIACCYCLLAYDS